MAAQITLTVNTDEEKAQVLALASALNLSVDDGSSDSVPNETLEGDRGRAVTALRELVKMGGIEGIDDPSAWQREIRREKSPWEK